MSWFWFAFLTSLFWALGGVLIKPAYKYFSEGQIYAFNGLSFFLIWLVFALLTGNSVTCPINYQLILPLLSPLSFLFFVYSLKNAKPSIISALIAASPLVTTGLSIIFLGESINSLQLGIIILLVIVLIKLGLTEYKANDEQEWKGFLLGLICSMAFGISNAVNKFAVSQIGPVPFSVINGVYMIVISRIWLVSSQKITLRNWQGLVKPIGKQGLLGSLIYGFGGFFFFLGLQSGPASLVTTITNLNVPFTMIFAGLILKETTTKTQRILIFLTFLLTTGLVLF